MALVIDEAIWRMFPGMLLVVATGTGLDNQAEKPALQRMLKDVQIRLKDTWQYQNAQSHPHVAAWRQAFRAAGISGKQFPSSIEAMCRRVLSGGEVGTINPLVNFYNAISLKHVVPLGAWDIDSVQGGDIFLRLTRDDEPFTELGQSSPTYVKAGEVAYADAEKLITRHFVWRQSDMAKIVPATSRFFLVSEILPAVGREVAERVRRDVVEGMREHFGIELTCAILDSGCSRWEWQS